MKRIIVSVATCALVLAGCSLNEVLDAPDARLNDGAIRFGVNTPVTRAANLWDNDNFAKSAGKFKVVGATTAGVEYLGTFAAPKLVEYKDNEWTYDNKLYWPSTSLNFFTWSDANNATTPKVTATDNERKKMVFEKYTVKDQVAEQSDFLVGAGEYTKEEFSTIHLKHALTKVLFKAEVVAGSQLNVKIDAVEICNLKNVGDLTVTPQAGVANVGAPTMEWGNQTAGTDDTENEAYSIAAKASGSQDFISLKPVGATNAITSLYDGSAANGNIVSSMLLTPQYFNAWEPLTKKIAKPDGDLLSNVLKNNDPAYAGGAFIRLKCNIMALDTEGEDLEELYKGATPGSTKWLYIPVSSAKDLYGAWEANRAITYIITFGDAGSGSGGGGWTGDDGDGDGNVDPVLVPINFRVEVSDWDKYDVILQSVNFKKEGVTDATIQGELDNIATMLLTEASNNPQKQYAAKFDFTYGEAVTARTFTMSDKFKNNDKFLGGSTIAIKVTANTWGGTLTFPTIEGWTADKTTLATDGTVTYTKDLIAEVETHRLNALKHKAMMVINGKSAATTATTTTWTYTGLKFPMLTAQGDYAVLHFTGLEAGKGITVDLGTSVPAGFVIAAGADLKTAVTAAATASIISVEATETNEYVVIYRKTVTP